MSRHCEACHGHNIQGVFYFWKAMENGARWSSRTILVFTPLLVFEFKTTDENRHSPATEVKVLLLNTNKGVNRAE